MRASIAFDALSFNCNMNSDLDDLIRFQLSTLIFLMGLVNEWFCCTFDAYNFPKWKQCIFVFPIYELFSIPFRTASELCILALLSALWCVSMQLPADIVVNRHTYTYLIHHRFFFFNSPFSIRISQIDKKQKSIWTKRNTKKKNWKWPVWWCIGCSLF